MVKDLKDLVLSKVSGINSGMVINTPLFEKVRYNEELFLQAHYLDLKLICMITKSCVEKPEKFFLLCTFSEFMLRQTRNYRTLEFVSMFIKNSMKKDISI